MEFYLLTFSVIPLFVSRAFIPLFATACMARWGRDLDPSWLGVFEDFTGLHLLDSIPAWTIRDETLLVLAAFAALELLLRHIPDARVLVDGVGDSTLKAMCAGCCSYLLVGGDLAGIYHIWVETGDLTTFQWGLGLQYTWSFGIGVAVFLLASARSLLFGALDELDPEDDLGMASLLVWLESSIGFVGVLFAFILPGLAALMAVLGIASAWGLQRTLRAIEVAGYEPCASCATEGPKCGPACAACGTARVPMLQVGWLGRITDRPATNPARHRHDLVAARRCHGCGHRLTSRRVGQACPHCEATLFETAAAFQDYLDSVRRKLPATMLVCGAFSAVPVLGLLPGILYYRLSLVSGLRAYMPPSNRMLRRWLLRFVQLLLVLVQGVPILGAAALPLLCLSDYTLSMRMVEREGHSLGGRLHETRA